MLMGQEFWTPVSQESWMLGSLPERSKKSNSGVSENLNLNICGLAKQASRSGKHFHESGHLNSGGEPAGELEEPAQSLLYLLSRAWMIHLQLNAKAYMTMCQATWRSVKVQIMIWYKPWIRADSRVRQDCSYPMIKLQTYPSCGRSEIFSSVWW